MVVVNPRIAAVLTDLGWVEGRDFVITEPLPDDD